MPDSGSSHRECNLRAAENIGVAILAAGRSSRMGRAKLLLPWGGTTIIGHLIAQWRELNVRQLAVVHAADDERLCAELARLGIDAANRIPNAHPERGMFSSVQCAANWMGWEAELGACVLALGDQPQVRVETLERLLVECKKHPGNICVPGYEGRARHPVLLPIAEFRALRDVGARVSTLKEFLDGKSIVQIEVNDPGLAMDIDTPEAYGKVLGYSFPEM